MEASGRSEQEAQRRPLLAGGEHLASQVDRPGRRPGKTHPRTLEEAIALLSPQLEELQEGVASTPPSMRGARVVFEAEVLPNYVSNSDFPKELFTEADLVPVGTRVTKGVYRTPKSPPEERESKNYLLAADERSLAKLGDVMRREQGATSQAEKARLSLRQFDVLRLPGSSETLRGQLPAPGETITWEAVFHPVVDRRGLRAPADADDVWDKWIALVGDLGGEIATRYRRRVKDLLFVPVRLPSDVAAEAAEFNPLRALRPMPTVRPVPISPLRMLNQRGPEPPPGERPQSDVRVAVFDGGVDEGASQLAPFVTNTDLTSEDPDPDDLAHGTLVTAAVLFGPDHGESELRTPEIGVDHYRVLPVPEDQRFDLDLYWILDHIENQLAGGTHTIVNLSLGPDQCLEEDDDPHPWTATLDELAERDGILFVNAVGNNGEADSGSGANRIKSPSDMVNGLGIGSCDARSPVVPWARAPYSAVGPGRPGSRMQPAGLAFGGVPARPFRGVSRGGNMAEACGTSFATPSAVHGLSALAAQLGDAGRDPSVLRAFAAHFAEPPEEESLHDEVGFGRLIERYDGTLDCRPNEATILYRDEIQRGEMRSLPFPLAPGVVDNNLLFMHWTLAFVAPTDPKDSAEYTQAGLEMSFRPHAQILTFTKPGSDRSYHLNVAEKRSEVANLLAEGYSPSPLPKTASAKRWRHETLRRQEDGKWETLHRAKSNKRGSSLYRPQVTLLYLAREEGDLSPADPLNFAMLLTMRARADVALYDSVRTTFPILNPLRTRLPLRLST